MRGDKPSLLRRGARGREEEVLGIGFVGQAGTSGRGKEREVGVRVDPLLKWGAAPVKVGNGVRLVWVRSANGDKPSHL